MAARAAIEYTAVVSSLGIAMGVAFLAKDIPEATKHHSQFLAGANLIKQGGGTYCATIDVSGLCLVWDLSNGQVVRNWRLPAVRFTRASDRVAETERPKLRFDVPPTSRLDLAAISAFGNVALWHLGEFGDDGRSAGSCLNVELYDLGTLRSLGQFPALTMQQYDWGLLALEFPVPYILPFTVACLVRNAHDGSVQGFLAYEAEIGNKPVPISYVDCTTSPVRKLVLPLALENNERVLAAKMHGDRLLVLSGKVRFAPDADKLQEISAEKAWLRLFVWQPKQPMAKAVTHQIEIDIPANAYLYAADAIYLEQKARLGAIIAEPDRSTPCFLSYPLVVTIIDILPDGKKVKHIPVTYRHTGMPMPHPKCTFSADAKYVIVDYNVTIVADIDNSKQLYRWPSSPKPRKQPAHDVEVEKIVEEYLSAFRKEKFNNVYETIGLLPEEDKLVQASRRGEIVLWDLKTGREVRRFLTVSKKLFDE